MGFRCRRCGVQNSRNRSYNVSVPPNETGQTAKSCRCTSVVTERHSPPTSGKNGGAETAWADSPEWLRPGKTNGAPAEKNQPVRLQFLQFDHVFVVSLISTFSCTLHFPIFQNFLVTELHFFRKSDHIPDPDHHALILPLFGSLCFLQAVRQQKSALRSGLRAGKAAVLLPHRRRML